MSKRKRETPELSTCLSEFIKVLNDAVRDREERDVLFCVGSLYLIGELKQEVSPC